MEKALDGVVIYGVGSPIIVDIEESLIRADIQIRAAIQNQKGECFLEDVSKILDREPDKVLKETPFIAPFFSPGNRKNAVQEATKRGFVTPFSLIDPSTSRPRTLRYGPGLYVNSGCSLGGASDFGPFLFINRGACIGHHFRCDAYVSIGPGAVIAGQVEIGRGAFIGAGAIILPKIRVGANSVIAAGSVVTRQIPEHCLVAGNPARIIKEVAGYKNATVEQDSELK